jgi:phage tail-like protein
MADARVSDPAVNFRFTVTSAIFLLMGGTGFSKVSGLRDESEVMEYREGSDLNLSKRKFAGLREYPAMVFTKGATKEGFALMTWRKLVLNGKGYRSGIVVQVNDVAGTPVRKYSVENAWPSSLEMDDLDAMSSEVAIESMEIQHEGNVTKRGMLFS